MIRGHQLPSRVTFGPIVTNLGDGRRFSDRHAAFYRERAAGGCGLIVTEDASVHPSDWPYERCPDAATAGPGWSAIAAACAEFGTVAVAGVSHAGGQSSSAFSQLELWAPSDEPDVNTREVPKIMEQVDVDAVVAGFGTAAATAAEAGMAGVEVNGGQFSLVRQFLSGLTNRRTDGYGQDRSLFARQVLGAVRAGVGNDALVGLRLSCDELAPWAGITPESAAAFAAELAPMIDYLVVVRGSIFSVSETRPTAHHQPGFNLDLVSQIGAAVAASDHRVPVIAQGSIVSVSQAEKALTDGICDAVEMTRAQMADPALVANARVGRSSRPCVLCNQLCNVRDNRNPIISCIANPRAGHETTDQPEPPIRPMPASSPGAEQVAAGAGVPVPVGAVVVVGAGPAGLEAARIAARRGFPVDLYESTDRVGGMAMTAAVAPAHRRLAGLMSWLEDDARHHGVRIHLAHTVTAEELDRRVEAGHHVIVATGSTPAPPTFTVDPAARVVDGAEVLAAIGAETGAVGPADATDPADHADPVDRNDPADPAETAPVTASLDTVLDGEEIAIWDPIGGPAGVAIAELLAGRRPKVSLITPDAIAGTMLSLTGDLAGANVRLQQAGVAIVRRRRLRTVSADGLDLVHTFTGASDHLPADVVVDASSRHPDPGPQPPMADPRVPGVAGPVGGNPATTITIGDAVAPRTVAEAIREGRAAALALEPGPTAVTAAGPRVKDGAPT